MKAWIEDDKGNKVPMIYMDWQCFVCGRQQDIYHHPARIPVGKLECRECHMPMHLVQSKPAVL